MADTLARYFGLEGFFTVLCLLISGGVLWVCAGLWLASVSASVSEQQVGLPRLLTRALAGGWGNGVLLGLGCGLLGGSIFELAQTTFGSLTFVGPHSPGDGLLSGIGVGVLVGAVGGRLSSCPRGVVVGLVTGLGGGLVLFQLVGTPEVGFASVSSGDSLIFPLLGGLLGALLGVIIACAFRRQFHWQRPLAIGAGVGLLGGLALALIGTVSGLFAVDSTLPGQGGPQGELVFRPWLTSQPMLHGQLVGFGLFAVTGALIGGVAGELASSQKRSTIRGEVRTSAVPQPSWLTFAPGLLLGLVGGLSTGLGFLFIGGPEEVARASAPTSPQAGMAALLVGSVVGLAGGIGIAIIWNRAERLVNAASARRSRRSKVGVSMALVVLGLVILSLPYWFVPLVAFTGGH
ncbi:MAG: hypothetical protein ACLQUY_23225 [Ktedonobacterales bacterium]